MICSKCNIEFPNYQEVDGKIRDFHRRKYCLVCNPFGKRINPDPRVRMPKWCEKNILESAVKSSISIRESMVAAMKLAYGSEDRPSVHYVQFHYYVQFHKIDISHFHRVGTTNRILSDEDVFRENSKVCQAVLRRYYKRKFPDERCSCCGLKEWMNKLLPVDVDHINGHNTDNRLENLHYLCPNCHRQTGTHSRQHRKPIPYQLDEQRKAERLQLREIKPIRVKKEKISKPRIVQYKTEWPIDDELARLVWEKPLTTLAKEFGVSDVAITKRCRKRNITTPAVGYWAKAKAMRD